MSAPPTAKRAVLALLGALQDMGIKGSEVRDALREVLATPEPCSHSHTKWPIHFRVGTCVDCGIKLCGNCQRALPGGCRGEFKHQQGQCALTNGAANG